MNRPLSVPLPALNGFCRSSSCSTSHYSFLSLFDPADPQDTPIDIRPRSCSHASLDSGYFSTIGKDPSIKSIDRRFSCADMRHPLVPINGPPNLTQESPKREGGIKNFLRMRKKSMPALSPTRIDPFPFNLPVPRRRSTRCTSVSPSESSDPYFEPFEPLDRFAMRRGMKHHPYPRDGAPYMRAYDRALLDNDKFTELLLQRLNENRSPSFIDFSHAAPKTILDLGCGPGDWAVQAAEFWPSSLVIGFDLVDPARLRGNAEVPGNVQWRQGNFVKYKLPFPKDMFDFVRMANLSLCIPKDRWEYVLSEVRRVLAQGGCIELIDDHLYFPYTKNSPYPSSDSPTTPSSSDGGNGDGTEEGIDTDTDDGTDDDDDDDDDDEDFVSTKSRFSSVVDVDAEDFFPLLAYDPVSEWNQTIDNSKALEKVFEDMLLHKFSIHPRPSKLLDGALDCVFGRYNNRRLHEFNLYLAPPSIQDSDDSSLGSSESQNSTGLKKAGKDFAKWMTTVEWDHREREKRQCMKGDRSSSEGLPNPSMLPEALSPKAASRLGIKHIPSQLSRTQFIQSPGLILWPATYIPIPPLELEMHTCKHLHSVIGCKAALVEFLQDIARDQQLPFDDQWVEDRIWEYESFRRKRFNWPSECPDYGFDSPVSSTTPRSNTSRHPDEQARPRTGSGSMSPPPDPLFPRDKLDFVRAIRVYTATKIDEEMHIS